MSCGILYLSWNKTYLSARQSRLGLRRHTMLPITSVALSRYFSFVSDLSLLISVVPLVNCIQFWVDGLV